VLNRQYKGWLLVASGARKLAVILHRLWRDGTSFRWSTH
jgi:hypothetical protein